MSTLSKIVCQGGYQAEKGLYNFLTVTCITATEIATCIISIETVTCIIRAGTPTYITARETATSITSTETITCIIATETATCNQALKNVFNVSCFQFFFQSEQHI